MKALPQMVKAFLVGLLELGLVIVAEPIWGSDTGTMLGGPVLMSIISTAGLSLLIWIPVLTGMGMVTLALLGLVFPAMRAKPGEGSRSGASGTLSSGSSLSNVSRYVERIQGAGVPDEMILARLMRAGWSKDELTQAGVNDLLQV